MSGQSLNIGNKVSFVRHCSFSINQNNWKQHPCHDVNSMGRQ